TRWASVRRPRRARDYRCRPSDLTRRGVEIVLLEDGYGLLAPLAQLADGSAPGLVGGGEAESGWGGPPGPPVRRPQTPARWVDLASPICFWPPRGGWRKAAHPHLRRLAPRPYARSGKRLVPQRTELRRAMAGVHSQVMRSLTPGWALALAR